jgi:hypothetical protein
MHRLDAGSISLGCATRLSRLSADYGRALTAF